MKRILAIVISMFIIMALVAGCGETNSTSEATKKIVIGTQEVPESEGMAVGLGYYKEEMGKLGYDVEIMSFSSGAKLNAAILADEIDFAYMGTCPAANGLSNGVEAKVVWLTSVIDTHESLAVKNESGVTEVKDLVGKTIATPFASTAHYSLLKAIEVAGIDAKDVDIVDMEPANINAAWERGDIDGAFIWNPTLSELKSSNGTIIMTAGKVADAGYPTANLNLVRTKFAEENPEAVEAYVLCLSKATDLYLSDQDAAIKAIADYLNISEDDARMQANGCKWYSAKEIYDNFFANGAIAQTLYKTAEFLYNQGGISELPELSYFEDAIYIPALEAIISK